MARVALHACRMPHDIVSDDVLRVHSRSTAINPESRICIKTSDYERVIERGTLPIDLNRLQFPRRVL